MKIGDVEIMAGMPEEILQKCRYPMVLQAKNNNPGQDYGNLYPILDKHSIVDKIVWLLLRGQTFVKCKIIKNRNRYYAQRIDSTREKYEIFFNFNWYFKD